ncbi:UPL family protein [Abortiporus biennis]
MKIVHKSKRALPPLPQVAELIDKLLETPNEDLHEVLGQIDSWKWPRSDLNAWIKVLNKFDVILEEVIRDYDIDKIQVNVLTPLTKKTVCEILRFERLLLENSTNRKTFNSYDRLRSLLFASDLDVLTLTLNLLLRPAQQYSAQPAVSSALNISTPRLTSLAKRWPNLREYDLNLVDLVDEKCKAQIEALPVEAREVNFTFYPKTANTSPKEAKPETDVFDTPITPTPSRKNTLTSGQNPPPPSGSVTVHIDHQILELKPAMDILADAVEQYSVPDEEKFELLCRIRTAQAMSPLHSAEREKLLNIRLLATAIFGHTHQEQQAQSSLFIYEPDFISHVAGLLQLDRGINYSIQTAAIAALDALGRYKGKIQEVLTAVNAGVNHGILMALLRKTITQAAEPDLQIPQAFVESLLSFVTYIATHASGGNMVVGAGLVPLLIQIIENRLPHRLYIVSKAMQLVDNVLYGYTNAFTLFCNSHGVDALVDRIEFEVDLDLKEHTDLEPPPEIPVTYGKLSVARSATLKHIMRSMHRMMQSSGTSEGLRGLLDSSLLKSMKKIMENRHVFGPSILPLAINIMATFVHNEPTCLNVIQEAGLPDAFYKIVESGLEPVIEVIQSVPNAIGALCLNQAGQDQLTARPTIIPALFSIFVSERHQRVLQEKENAVLIGTSIEELIRHHPSLKDSVFQSIKTTLGTIEELGKNWVCPEDLKPWYTLQPVSSPNPVATSGSDDHDVVMEAAEPTDTAPKSTEPADDEASPKSHDNIIISYIDVFCKFIEGFFQHVPHCRDFITNTDGLERLGRLTALPSLPYDFPNSVASDSLVQVVRTMIEASTNETLIFLVGLINQSLEETKQFRDLSCDRPVLRHFIDLDGEQLSKANEDFRKLVTLHVRIMLLSDIYATAGYQGRATATLLQALVGKNANNLLLELGALHRACAWDNILLKSDPTFSSLFTSPNLEGWPVAGSSTMPSGLITPVAHTPAHIDGAATPAANGVPVDGSTAAPATVTPTAISVSLEPKKEEGAKERNAKALKHISNQIPNALLSLFQAIVRLFQIRRNPDATQKQRILEASQVVADVLIEHLAEKQSENKVAVLSYYTVALTLTSISLFDDGGGSQKSVQLILVHAMYRKGGIARILELCRLFIKTIAEIAEVKEEDRSETSSRELLHAYGALKVALHLLHPLITAGPIIDSSQTQLLVVPDKKETDPDFFEPHNFVVQLRLAVIPLVREIWEASWLTSAPLSVCKSVVQVVLEMLNVAGEVKESSPADILPGSSIAAALPLPRPPIGPDENRIRQLTEMGFPRSAAERALIRTRNNVTAAADLLISHPFPLPPDPEPAAQTTVPATDEDATSGSALEDTNPEAGPSVPPTEQSTNDESVVQETHPLTAKSPEVLLQELNDAREPFKDGLGQRALALVDEHPSLVFDVQKVFVGPSIGNRDQSVQRVIDDIKSFATSAYDHQEHPLAVRFRLLALVLTDPSSALASIPTNDAKALMDVLLALLLSNPPNADTVSPTVPKWLAGHLLVTETLLMAGEEPKSISLPKEGEPIERGPIATGPLYSEARTVLFDFTLRMLAIPTLPRDELISTLRVLVLLTRDHNFAVQFTKRGGVELLFQSMKALAVSNNPVGIHPSIAMILRHVVEDSTTLQNIMRQEVKRFFANPRNRMLDVGNYVRSCSAMALRDSSIFTQVTEDLCKLSHPYGMVKSISLKNAGTGRSTNSNPANIDDPSSMQVDEPSTAYAGSETAETIVHFLISELMKTVKKESPTDSSGEKPVKSSTSPSSATDIHPATPAASEEKEKAEKDSHHQDYIYACFLMQTLTELLFSYDACKLAFLSYSPKKRLHTPAKETGTKHRTAALHFLISDLIVYGTVDSNPQGEEKKQAMLCNWAMSVIVALCVDTFPSHDIKDVPAERISVRKFVLESVNRAIKDLPPSDNVEERYSRLLALADLCYRLLSVRFNLTSTRKTSDDTPTHMAKVMLEKNFVATLTNALAEVDLNYPRIRHVVTGILRPLEYLTKIAIRMSRVSDKHKDLSIVEESDSEESDISDEDEDTADEEHVETPDLYRNSSLGMYGGAMDDAHYGPDDEMDEDMEEEEDDVEMDYGDDTASEDTSNTDEEEDVDDLEDDLENETGESEEGWQDEDEDGEEDLIQHDEGNEDDDDEDEGDEDGEEVMWQDVTGDDTGDDLGDEGDEEPDDTIPIMQADAEEEADMMSEDEYDDLGLMDDGPVAGNLFVAAGYPNPYIDGIDANAASQPFWQGLGRTRRRGAEEDTDFFSRSRAPPAAQSEFATHPLLVDPAALHSHGTASSRGSRRFLRGATIAGIPLELLQNLESTVGGGAVHLFHHIFNQGRGGNPETIRIDVPPGSLIPQHLQRPGRGVFSASIRVERVPHGDQRDQKGFDPLMTLQRWSEENKALHGKFETSRLAKLSNHVTLALLPAAVEAIKKAKAEEEQEAARQKEALAKAEAESKAKEEEDKIRQEELKAEEERLAAEAKAEEESRSRSASNEPTTSSEAADADAEMVDAEETAPVSHDATSTSGEAINASPELPVAEAGPSTTNRVTVTIHGNEVDITDTGIDPTFLEALPDEMREEVLNQHVRDQRAARVERPADSQISDEFLDALPPELRAEIIQQEAIERARRQAEQSVTQDAPAAAPADIDPASFIASLDPQLRQVVLMDSDDVFIQSLPSHMIAEAGIYREHQTHRPPRAVATTGTTRHGASQPSQPPKTPLQRDAIQLLDKPAIAMLVRLLFFPEVLRKNMLSKVLVNLCENSKTRTDIFNLLLNILQDGTGDLAAIDKSFAQMSFRNSKAPPLTPKAAGKQRMQTDYFAHLPLPQNEILPELVAQRCLETLTYIVGSNELSSLFFLTEHELPAGLRRSASKKGKGKEKQAPQTHYPIVLLLSLLDRQSLLKTPSLMEYVVALLALVTRPLASLQASKAKTGTKPIESSAPSTSETSNTASETQSSQVDTTAVITDSSAQAPAAAAASEAKPQTEPAATVEEKILLTNPPNIPHGVLRLIVNILTVGECSGRTFSHSLALIQHLSYIPDARDVIAQELRTRAQEFGQSLYDALDELAVALQESRMDSVTSAVATKFSPASADQAKLLRVLKTIDYMYSPKSTSSPSEAPNQDDVEKLQSIYETFRFTALWRRLGDCLAIIEEKPELEHIATVLLPLIESLMVVCKYVGSQNSNAASTRALRASTSPKSPSTSRESMEDLFVSFTDAHRKVLNIMVRSNPSLMSGSFSLLVHNPRVLDFDNKRNYFNQQVHRRPHTREHYSTLQLNVRRQRVFEDSFQYLQRKTGEQIKHGKLSIRFYDEEGVDAGGVTREWFQILARQMFDPNYALFQPCAADKLTYQPNKASYVNPEHLSFFKFVGRVIGKAIYDGRLLDAYFARSLYRQLLGKPVDYRDVEWVDPEYYNSLCWILENDPSALELTFSVEADEFGVTKIIDLKEGGASIPVTQENKREFVQLSAQYRLYSSIKDQIEALLAGFYEIIPKDLITIFDEKELELLISGTPDIDVDEWRAATEYNGYTSSDPVIVWWWRALKSFNREERAKVLSFATGTSRVPLGGFVELQGVQGVQKFSIHRAYGDADRLPQAHTCFNQIDLPQYSSYEMLRQQLLLAIHEGGEGFGFA